MIKLNDPNLQKNAEIIFPEQLKVIREVTEDEEYKNSALAKM